MSNGAPNRPQAKNAPREAADGPGGVETAEKVPPHAKAFKSAFTDVYNEIFKVVFFPDRIYHERYLNATRSPRYRYNVREVRSYLDITAMKSEVYLDGKLIGNVLRIEYGASRLVEQIREKQRFMRDGLIMWIQPLSEGVPNPPQARVRLTYDIWTHTFQVEIWRSSKRRKGRPTPFRCWIRWATTAPSRAFRNLMA